MDSHLTFETHVKQLCKTSFFHFRNIARLRPMLTLADAEKLVHDFVSHPVWTTVMRSSSGSQAKAYRNCSTARTVLLGSQIQLYNHITPILKSLHWLPVSFRIVYKVSLLTHQCIHVDAPSYLKELLTPQTFERTLCSTYLFKTPQD